MKKLTLFLFLLQSVLTMAQAPQKMAYQSVLRNATNQIVANQSIGVKISIVEGALTGTTVYSETHTTTTNANGLFTLEAGGGTPITGTFSEINWGNGSHYIKSEIDVIGGTNYSLSGTMELLSVPYALYAATAGNSGTLSTLQTNAVTEISFQQAKLNGDLINNGNQLIIAKGFCIGTTTNPGLGTATVVPGNTLGAFVSTATALVPNTTYYVRAFATSTSGTAYGQEVSFSTLPLTTPTVSTGTVSAISSTSATATGRVTATGGSPTADTGFCWATTPNPTVVDSTLTLGAGSADFIVTISNLTATTTYYIRAYATNAQGTSYGNEQVFTTTILQLATLSATTVTAVLYTTATISGQVITDGGTTVTQRGVCYGTQSNPTINDNLLISGTGTGVFSVNLTGLSSNTLYYARTFATNAGGTAYGTETTFTTLEMTAPTVSTSDVFSIDATSASSGGNVTADGGSPVTNRGICYGTQPNPTLQDSYTVNGTGTGAFNSVLTNLTLDTTYYVRAYATNALGTSFGNSLTFTNTTDAATGPITNPAIGTKIVTKNPNSYTSGGYVSSTGGLPIIRMGICYKPGTDDPTTGDTVVYSSFTGLGFFNIDFTLPNTCQEWYSVRAFVENSAGITYGNRVNFQTGFAAVFTTTAATEITGSTAVSGGFITQDGGCAVLERGVCWSKNTNPTTANYKAASGSGTGSYTTTLTSLFPNTTYYMRAYIISAKGTFYGEQQTFTTIENNGLYIGKHHAGGIIFYLDATGNHGMICAETNQGYAPWGCRGTQMFTSTSFGSGAQNTASIVLNCSEANTAAKICNDLELNSYTDWYLPSLEELSLMSSNLNINGIGNFDMPYWSSSEIDNDYPYSYFIYPNYNMQAPWYNKDFLGINIRAVRNF